MINYFYNEQGDYTITSNDVPVAYVKTEQQAQSLVSIFALRGDVITELRLSNNTIEHENRKLKTSLENKEKIMKEMGERFHAKLMSTYYMLGTIKKMGTHHEKAVAVGYVMQTIDDLLKNDNMSWNQDWFDMPF
jgi:predicted metal-dependent RNase